MNSGALGIPKRPDPQFHGSVDIYTPVNGVNGILDPGPHNIIRIHSSTATQVFGIKGGVDGRILVFHFVDGGSTVTFMHEHATPQPNERIVSPYGSDFKAQATTNSGITMAQTVVLFYDGSVQRWKPMHQVFDEGNPSGVSGTIGPASGTSQSASHSDHIHLLSAHAHASHTDRTRYIWIPANDMQNDDGTATSTGASPDLISARVMADAVATGSYFTWLVPEDWVSASAVTAVIFWSTPTTVATSAVRWRLQRVELVAGTTDVTSANTLTEFTGASQTHTAGILYSDSSSWFTPTTAGNVIKAGIRRVGGDAADTLTANARVHGIRIEYTADM